MQDLNLAGSIKTVQKWTGTLEGVKLTPQGALKRAGAMELASSFGTANCWPYELRKLNRYAPQCFHPQNEDDCLRASKDDLEKST